MSPATETFPRQLDRLQRWALVAGLAALAVCIVGGFYQPQQFFRSYLMAYLFWSGISLGSLALVMLHHLVGGEWGFLIRRLLESATRTVPLVAFLIVPILFGIPYLYVWSDYKAVVADPVLLHKHGYLNGPFFTIRAVLYFSVWLLFIYLLNKWSSEQDSNTAPSLARKLYNLSGPGLIVYGLTMTLASLDWVMSLEPDWYSTIYSAMFMVGQVLSGLAFVIAVVVLLADDTSLSEIATPTRFNDLGNMLLTFVILWTYLAFSQFLIIWTGNLTEEIPWYLHRTQFGWRMIAEFLILFHFAVPFLLLLLRKVKRRIRVLSLVAAGLLISRLVDMFWMVEPAFDRTGLRFHWLDWLMPIGIGGIWVAVFISQLKARPLLPRYDPGLRRILAPATGD